MATRSISTKIKLEGEREFKQALTEINGGLSVLGSEMKKVSAEYKSNADSVEALTKKGDVLERTLLSQKDKVDTLQKALENAKKEYGEADSRTMKWEKTLNDAEAAVYNTEAAIKENNEALEAAKKATDSNSVSLADMAEKLGIHLPEGAQKALGGINGFSAGSVVAIGAVAAAITGVVETYKKLITMATESAAQADNILTLAQITGLDTNSVQELQYASELIDVSFESIQDALKELKNKMQDTANGSDELIRTFRSLGVNVTDTATGELRSAADVFYDVIDALGDMGNATERDAVAMDVFGESAQKLNPLIVQGIDILKGYQEEAENVGAVLSGTQLEALVEVDNAYQRLQKTQEGIKNQMSAELAPEVAELYTSWTEFIAGLSETMRNSVILDFMKEGLQLINNLLQPVNWLFNTALPNIREGLSALDEKLTAIRQSGIVLWIEDMIRALNALTSTSGRLALIKGQGEMKPVNEWNAPGDRNFEGGWTWVGENGAELVNLPRGSQILNAQESRNMSGDTYYITIDAKNVREFNDVVRIMQNSKSAARRHA